MAYTEDWFSINIRLLNKWVVPELKDRPNVHILEIGSYQGRSAVWMVQNILTGPGSSIWCCDTFQGSSEHTNEQKQGIYERFLCNMSQFPSDKYVVLRGRSDNVVRHMGADKDAFFDMVYIDGDHHSHAALTDAVLSWRLLKPGGLMFFDDCGGGDKDSLANVLTGVLCFLRCWEGQYDWIDSEYGILIRKTCI
jgi:hypothetical protein